MSRFVGKLYIPKELKRVNFSGVFNAS
ncbi:hypothetical protein AVEN_132111-1, partial [Araneus ventricosus]